MTCPTCRAPWRETAECPRCGSDLAPLMRIAFAASRHRRAALAAIAVGEEEEALAHARRAAALLRSDADGELAFLVGLLM